MASEEHLQIIRQGVDVWNAWRQNNPELIPDLRWANLSRADLSGANLVQANLAQAILVEADLSRADLSQANLGAANLSRADLSQAYVGAANLFQANLTGANLIEANLMGTMLVRTDLSGASLAGSSVYGASVWDIKVDDQTKQQNLVITLSGDPAITVDNIKVAQFIYLLLNNKEIRDVIDTIGKKAVLILGRFSEERKSVLDAIRDELRKRDYLPIMFDFEPAKSRDTIETIRILAGMAKFIIADLTEAKAVVQELQAIVPNLPSVAVRFLIKKSEREPGMFDHIRRFPWVLPEAFEYDNVEEVIRSIKDNVVVPAEAKVKELRQSN